MKVGDLVRYHGVEGPFWLVTQVDPKRTGAATLQGTDGQILHVAWNLDVTDPEDLVVQGNPSTDWRLILVPPRTKLGRIVNVEVFDGSRWTLLTPFVQWTVADPSRCGGGMFIHPSIALVIGGLIRVKHDKGDQMIRVPSKGGTIKQRQVQSAPPPKPAPKTAYDAIGDEDD